MINPLKNDTVFKNNFSSKSLTPPPVIVTQATNPLVSNTSYQVTPSSKQKEAETLIKKAISTVEDADDQIDDGALIVL